MSSGAESTRFWIWVRVLLATLSLALGGATWITAQTPEDSAGRIGSGADGLESESARSRAPRLEAPAAVMEDDAPSLFVQAGAAYREGRYSEAAARYQELVERGFDGADVRYNLGNAYLRSGELALAIAEYRKALILDPRDRDARANLAFARQSATDAVAPPAPAAWRRALLFWHDSMGWGEKVRLALVLALGFWLLLALRLWRGRWLGTVWPAGLLALIALILTASAVAEKVIPTKVAVILPVQVDVYSGTDLRSQVIFNLHSGTEVRVEQSDVEWTEFTLSDGRRGWLPTEQLAVVDSRRL